MLLLFPIRVALRPPVWKRAVHSAYCSCLCERLSILCASFIPFFGLSVVCKI